MRDKKHLTTTQAAKLAHLSPSTLLRAVQNKKLKAFSTPGGHFRIDPASLDAYLDSAGLEGGKKKVLWLRVTPAEARQALERIQGDHDFSVSEGPNGGEKPCVVVLDPSAPKKGKALLHAKLRRWCGLDESAR